MSCREGRADPEMRSAKRTTLQGFAVLTGAVPIPHWNTLSQYTFYGPWIKSFQDCWWDPEFPQLSQMVQSLPGFINLCLNVCSSDARVGFFSNPRVPLLWNYLARPSPPRTTVSIFPTRPAPHPRPLNRHTRHCNVNENSLYFSLKVLGNIAL